MTPREGVVAWGLFDKYGLTDHYETERDALERAEAAEKDYPRNGPYTVSALYAHPAATAREEAFYEAALAYFESDKARMAAFTGEVFIEGPESAAIAEAGKRLGAARAAYAALALARSTGGNSNA